MKRIIKKINRKKLFLGVGLFCLFISIYFFIADLFFSPIRRDLTVFLALIFWIFVIKALKFKSKVTFLILLLLIPLAFYELYIDPLSDISKRIFVWVYLVAIIGTVQKVIELSKKNKSKFI